jgi:acyl carrier protein
VGEICISGPGVARGYVNLPQLTEEKFVEHPKNPARRMYRTGDLGRWTPAGALEFLGRMDEQVKIRGRRIELGEVEEVLREQEGVKTAAVLVRNQEEGEPELCAYIVCAEESWNSEELETALAARLPSYMVPTRLNRLESMPITASGKLDRTALARLPLSSREKRRYVAPRTPQEENVAEVWRDVLGIDCVGAEDDFFRLGGHSLSAMRVAARLSDLFAVEVPISAVFEHSRLDAISIFVEKQVVASIRLLSEEEVREQLRNS